MICLSSSLNNLVFLGTPGRVFDMIRRRTLRTRGIKMLILDEADEMLNKGFKEQIYDVYRYLPPSTQVNLISATLPHEILEMTSKFMSDPIRILVKRDELTLEGTFLGIFFSEFRAVCIDEIWYFFTIFFGKEAFTYDVRCFGAFLTYPP